MVTTGEGPLSMFFFRAACACSQTPAHSVTNGWAARLRLATACLNHGFEREAERRRQSDFSPTRVRASSVACHLRAICMP
jgi:hypothetical protein